LRISISDHHWAYFGQKEMKPYVIVCPRNAKPFIIYHLDIKGNFQILESDLCIVYCVADEQAQVILLNYILENPPANWIEILSLIVKV
jgi:hypothetical protein